jgi:hypothetical protein
VYCCCDAANNPQPTAIKRIDSGVLTILRQVEVWFEFFMTTL